MDTGEKLDNIGLAAAMANCYARDASGFVALAALMLEGSVPEIVEVTRKPKSFFNHEKKIVGLKVTLGADTFTLDDPENGRGPIAQKIKVVRGITLKTETIRVDQWLSELEDAITEYAQNAKHVSTAIMTYLEQNGL
jgi:hypothetical protein